MMTWASDRSGIASSAARDSDSHPHTPRPITTRIVISGLRALPAITRPITPGGSVLVVMAILPERTGRANAALGSDEEVARADHHVAEIDEYQPAWPGIDHGRDRDEEPRSQRQLECHRRIHVRLELEPLVG